MNSIKYFLKNNQYKIQHSSGFRIYNGIAILADQEHAYKHPYDTCIFGELNIPGTDFEKCQEVACKYPYYAYRFARNISEANIEYCQEHACKNSEAAYMFAKFIPGANIEYCRKACENDECWKNEFDKEFPKKQSI